MESKPSPAARQGYRSCCLGMAGAFVLAALSVVSATMQAQPPSPWPTRLSVAAITATPPDLETTFRFPWITDSSCGPTARCNETDPAGW